jgi:hypothetical protein
MSRVSARGAGISTITIIAAILNRTNVYYSRFSQPVIKKTELLIIIRNKQWQLLISELYIPAKGVIWWKVP